MRSVAEADFVLLGEGEIVALPPELIAGRYRVLRAVGRGGMGTVWLCSDETLHREVAVKQIGAMPGESPDDTARAMREARLSAALNHRNAVSIYDVVADHGTSWLVMEYVPSRTLSQLIASEGQLPPARVAHIGAQVAAALTSAHSLGIVHRDIKPGNILVGADDLAKISDFGIARGHQDVQLTQTGLVTGTPTFFSPELARGDDPSFGSDVWAFGVTLYTAVEGAPPFMPQANPLAMLTIIASDPVPPPMYAGPLTPVLAAMLDRDTSRRLTMEQVLTGLLRVEQQAAAAGTGGYASTLPMDEPAPLGAGDRTAIENAVPAEPAYEEPVALPVGSSTWSDQTVTPPPTAPQEPNRYLRLAAVLAALLVVLGGIAVLVNALGLGSGGGAEPGSSSSSPSRSKKEPAQSTQQTSATEETSQPPSTQSSTSASTSSTQLTTATSSTTQTTESTGTTGQVPGTDPESFTRSYFATVTSDINAGWRLIAPQMRQATSRQSYDSFWGSIDSVEISDVSVRDPLTVDYTIEYQFADGDESKEDKQLTLEEHAKSYRITSDSTV